jgi:hypothetical protein
MSDLFFGFQLAAPAPPHDPWRTRLCNLVRSHTRDLGLQDQRGLFGALANLLLPAIDHMPLAFWDLIENGHAEYDDWVQGIEDDSAEPWQPDRSGARMDHVLVSAMFLVPQGGHSGKLIGERCDLPESEWTARSTIRQLVGTLSQLDFASVRGSAVYVTPGGDREAFALTELRGPGYDYLLPLR